MLDTLVTAIQDTATVIDLTGHISISIYILCICGILLNGIILYFIYKHKNAQTIAQIQNILQAINSAFKDNKLSGAEIQNIISTITALFKQDKKIKPQDIANTLSLKVNQLKQAKLNKKSK